MPLGVLIKEDFKPRTMDRAAKHFGTKAALTDEIYERLSTAAKQRAFRICTIHKANLIQRARDIIHRAIRDGTDYLDVRRELLELFDTRGVPRPAMHRLRLAFGQNTMQAYNDARRETLDDPLMTQAFPFRQYLTVGNGRAGVNNVRAEHAALHGLIFRCDDPFWDAHTPPWGYGCRCTFRPLTAGQVRRMRVKVRNYGYVRKRIPVPGRGGRGIKADPRFARDAKVDLAGIDKELREAVEEMIE